MKIKIGDVVRFRSKTASYPYRTISRTQKWDANGQYFAGKLKKDPLQPFIVKDVQKGYNADDTEYDMAILTEYKICVPCKLLVPVQE